MEADSDPPYGIAEPKHTNQSNFWSHFVKTWCILIFRSFKQLPSKNTYKKTKCPQKPVLQLQYEKFYSRFKNQGADSAAPYRIA